MRAIQDFDRALRLSPDVAALFNGRCYARASAGALAAALADCNEALRQMPGRADFLDSRGFTHLKMRQLPQALADYDAFIAIDAAVAGHGAPRRPSVRALSTASQAAGKLLADQSDNDHTALAGGVAGSRQASLRRTRCLS